MEVSEVKEDTISEQHVGNIGESEDSGVDFLEDLDTYFDDIDDRLIISRMVTVSVMKGMVEAVEKMAEEKIIEKDLELARMRESMSFLELGGDECEDISLISNIRDELNSLLATSLEENIRFRNLGGEISEKINKVLNARNELDSMLKSLSGSGSGQLVSQGSSDMDNFYRKLLKSHNSPSSTFWVENGHSQGSENGNGMPEAWDVAQLCHLDIDGLVAHFNSIITNMRRGHESQVQKMTEDYFSLKREYLKEKDYSLQHRKNKDLEIVRKKIPEVILKLDDIIVENEKLCTFSKEADTFTDLNNRVNELIFENQRLRISLSHKENEIKSLSEKKLQHSLAEENLKNVRDLESDAEDADIKMFLIHEVYDCVMRGLILTKNNDDHELEMFCIESPQNAKNINKYEIEDSDIESLVSQGLFEVIFREAIMDAKEKIDEMNLKYMLERDSRISIEKKALQREEEFKALIEENEKLKREMDFVVTAFEGEKKLILEMSNTLSKERDQLEKSSYEINSLKSSVGLLELSLNKRNEELAFIKDKLAEALDQVEQGKMDMAKVKRNVEVISEELRVANEERNKIYGISQKNQRDMCMLEEKENEQRRKMQSIIGLIHGLSGEFSGFERRVSDDIKGIFLRLEEFNSILPSLVRRTNILRRTTSVYKQKLERKCGDLEIAENEVDLLGDQVDTLLNLLEKMYIALDHYAPILQHYPGIMEILKLVRRELRGESGKLK